MARGFSTSSKHSNCRGDQERDELVWKHDSDGSYTVKSVYKLATSLSKTSNCFDLKSSSMHLTGVFTFAMQNTWKKVRKLKLPSKLKTFLWLYYQFGANYWRKVFKFHQLVLCAKRKRKQIVHYLFFACKVTRQIFSDYRFSLPIEDFNRHNFTNSFDILLKHLQHRFEPNLSIMVFTLWQLWKCRNSSVFEYGKLHISPCWCNNQ